MRKPVAAAPVLLFVLPTAAHAEVEAETAYLLDTFSSPVSGALVMWMAAGFALLDAAGSPIVHATGGWAGRTGVPIQDAWRGRYGAHGEIRLMTPSSLPLATLGTFILWLGWFGFNGGSQLARASGTDAIAMANVHANTCVAAMGGVPVHQFCGIWRTLAVPPTNTDAGFDVQLFGVSAEDDETGLDHVGLGIGAYTEFGRDHLAA